MKKTNKIAKISMITLGVLTISMVSLPLTTHAIGVTETSITEENITFTGLEDVTIELKTPFNPRQGVSAVDQYGKKMGFMVNSDQVNNLRKGRYPVYYVVNGRNPKLITRYVNVVSQTNEAPVLLGLKNRVVLRNSKVDLLEGITALDKEDGDLSKAIFVKGSLNTSIPNEISKITYSVTDSDGNTTTAEVNFFVM